MNGPMNIKLIISLTVSSVRPNERITVLIISGNSWNSLLQWRCSVVP